MADEQPPRADLLDALRAVLEALDIPHPATGGDEKAQREILHQRTLHAVVMLRSVLEPDRRPDVPWHTEYLRNRLAEHPAEGYKTWQQRAAELHADRKSEGRPVNPSGEPREEQGNAR